MASLPSWGNAQRSFFGFTLQRPTKLRHWGSLAQGKKAEVSRHAVGLIIVHRHLLCRQTQRFCHSWGSQHCHHGHPVNLASFSIPKYFPQVFVITDISCLSPSPLPLKPKSYSCSQVRLQQICKFRIPAWDTLANHCAHVWAVPPVMQHILLA